MDRKIEKKSWLKRNIFYLIFTIIIFMILIYQIIFSDHSSKLKVESDKISIETVRQDLFRDYIAVIGIVEPIQTIYIDATEGGRVEKIYIDEGSIVKKGDIILNLSNDNILLEISNNEAQVAQAVNEVKSLRVTLENQKINNQNQLIDLYYDLLEFERQYKYNEELFKKELVSREEYNASLEKFERNTKHYELLIKKVHQDSLFMVSRLGASEESVESMQENLKIIRSRLDKLLVRAPFDGELATLTPKVGEVIPYGRRIGTLNILDSYKLRVKIDENYISRVKIGLNGVFEFSDQTYPGIISKVYPEVYEGRFAVDMEFSKDIPKDIRIGQTSHIRLELGESKQAIIIPRGGFYQSTGGQWIFVVDKSGEFAYKRNIRIGRQNPNFYELIEGVESGEKVIVSSYDNFGTVDKLILK